MTFTSFPIWFVDVVGSVCMIVFSFLCLNIVFKLKKRDQNNVIWIYLLWVCFGLTGFAVSRSAGHIVKQILVLFEHDRTWNMIQPYSGAINTFMFVVVAAVTLFFERIWKIYGQIIKDQKALQSAHEELLYLNQNLERMVKDRTEAVRLMEKQISQADKLASIGQLSSGIAHEINNPLGIILGYTQLLMRNENPESDKYADLKTIEKHVRSCKTIVEDLLNFARSPEPKREIIDIHEAMDDVLHFIQHDGQLENVNIVKDYDRSVPEMLLDEKKIKQVLMNLIMNAKHAVGKSGTIRLKSRFDSSEKQVRLEVSDTGYGIEKKNLSRIFDPFFTTKPTGEGTGLGLSVSYGIIKSHDGEILVESEPGKGSTFTILFPVVSRNMRTTDETVYPDR